MEVPVPLLVLLPTLLAGLLSCPGAVASVPVSAVPRKGDPTRLPLGRQGRAALTQSPGLGPGSRHPPALESPISFLSAPPAVRSGRFLAARVSRCLP
ncbi:serine protease inhibitor Kazal-type 2 isoform X1 [Pezoporus occidentalis]|uniref:serine protease inhibitor Kazal-type 2 isoform X1 n=1 Tax=Pezoporus occidentalis TaxID=407982 RepID=UPI002F9151C4